MWWNRKAKAGVLIVRVTVDCDDQTQGWKSYNKLIKHTGKKPIVYLSPSGRGFHFIVRDLKISFEESLRLRELCGDDKNRIWIDKNTQHKPKQILWTKKEVIENGKKVMKKVKRIYNFEKYFKENVII